MQLTEVTPALKVINFETLTKDTQLAKEVQTNLIRLGLLDPPADGKFGRFSIQALKEFPGRGHFWRTHPARAAQRRSGRGPAVARAIQ